MRDSRWAAWTCPPLGVSQYSAAGAAWGVPQSEATPKDAGFLALVLFDIVMAAHVEDVEGSIALPEGVVPLRIGGIFEVDRGRRVVAVFVFVVGAAGGAPFRTRRDIRPG